MAIVFQAGDLTAVAIPDAEAESTQPLLERCEDLLQRDRLPRMSWLLE